MADEVGNTGSLVGSGGGSAETVESGNSGSETQEVSDGSSQPGGQGSTGNEGNVGSDEDGVVTDDQGRKYIPYEAFQARIDKLSAQKNETRDLLESIKNDPNIRKQFLESLNIGEQPRDSSDEANEPTPFEQFLAPLPQDHQAHYRNMAQAMAQEFSAYAEGLLEAFKKEHLSPIMSWIGEEKVNRFSQTNKDFGKYQQNIMKIMQEGRARTVEDAYKLASFEDKMKSTFSAGKKEEVDRRSKLNRAPITGSNNSGGGNTRNGKPMSLRDALAKAGADNGYTD